MELINIKINVLKIDKSKLFKGKSGTYMDAVLIPTPDSKYGNDYAVVQKTEKGEETILLGDAKIFSTKKKDPEATAEFDDSEQLPF